MNGEGVFRYANSKWFIQALQTLAATGIHGVAVDIWVRAGVLAGCLWLGAWSLGFGAKPDPRSCRGLWSWCGLPASVSV